MNEPQIVKLSEDAWYDMRAGIYYSLLSDGLLQIENGDQYIHIGAPLCDPLIARLRFYGEAEARHFTARVERDKQFNPERHEGKGA